MAEAFADFVFVDFPNSEKSDVRARVARPSSPHGKAGSAGKKLTFSIFFSVCCFPYVCFLLVGVESNSFKVDLNEKVDVLTKYSTFYDNEK